MSFNEVNLYYGTANKRDIILNESKFVGIAIISKTDQKLSIEKVSLQLNEKGINVPIYAYEIWSNNYIHSSNVTSSKVTRMTQLHSTIPVSPTESKRMLFVGYNQDDLKGSYALQMDFDFYKEPCKCNPEDYNAYKLYSDHIEIRGFEVEGSDFERFKLRDLDNIKLVTNNNYGLNLSLKSNDE